jgi:hypothetical protein
MAVPLRPPGSTLTRRAFLRAAGAGVLALVIGHRLAGDGAQTTQGGLRPKRADNLLEASRSAGLELRPTPVDENGPVFALNEPGAFLWRRIDGERTVDALAAQLGAAYRLPTSAALADTLAFLGPLMQIGLVFDPADPRG